MRVPEYQQSVQQQGLPNARLTTHYTADDFLGGTQKAAMQVGTDLAKSLAHDATNLAVDHYKQQLQESIHDQTRDADTQYRTQKQNAMYGVDGVNGQPRTPGFLDLQGKNALAPTANGQSPASALQDDLKAKRAAIADTLTSDSAKRDFNEHADNEDFHTNGMIQQHEGQQTRVFRANTLTADNDSLSREIEQGYNDPNRMQLAYDKLKKNNDEFARLNGLDERAGGIAARTQFSKSLKIANEAAIQNNDYQSADNNIRRFGAELDVNTTSDLKQSSFNAYTTALIQTDPQKVIDMTAPKTMPAMEFERVKQIRDAVESHGKDYNPDGSAVTHIDKDGIKSKYKNQVREDVAKDPGFGIKPAANDSPEEYNRVGDELLKAHYDYHKGDVEKTLAAYNGGRKGVDDAISSGGDWQAKAGVKDYLAKARLEANKTGTPMDYGTPMQHLHANNAAEAMIEKGRVNFKVGLESAYKDQHAQAYNTGNPGEPIPLSTFNQAYGEHGPEMHASYQDNISHAVQAFSIRDMPTANINKLLEDEKPKDINAENEPEDLTNKFNTSLSADKEKKFQQWAKDNNKENDTYDYDLRGAWLDLTSGKMKQAENGHLGDKYKKPNHPTFSDQSIYHNADSQGGHWSEENGSTSFTPSDINIKNLGADGLKNYFAKNEKGNQVIIPANTSVAANAEREWKQYDELVKSAKFAKETRDKDPMADAFRMGLGVIPIGDWSSAAKVSTELAKRTSVSSEMQANYGTPQLVLTNPEADSLAKHLGSLQAEDKATELSKIFGAIGPERMVGLSSQLKDKHSELAIASMLTSFTTPATSHLFSDDTPGKNVAQLYLQGKEALEQKRVKVDEAKETGTKSEIYTALQDVYQTPQALDAAAEASYGVWAAYKAQNTGDVGKAISLATGGIMEHNGGKIAKPYGMTDSAFSDQMAHTVPQAIKGAGGEFIVRGKTINADSFANMITGARLQTYGRSSYLVMSGSDVVRNADGSPYVLQVAR